VGRKHHDLCFGCGLANLFGLQVELDRQPDGSVAGRFFVKQDHQGSPGYAHAGILAAALDEAMALAAGEGPQAPMTAHLELDVHAEVPVGVFVRLAAEVERGEGEKVWVRAAAFPDEEGAPPLAEARAVLVAATPPG
jgi:acyl-coenzyme A thioesterase PaaI-like protein